MAELPTQDERIAAISSLNSDYPIMGAESLKPTMGDTSYMLHCFIEGDHGPIKVIINRNNDVDDLKNAIVKWAQYGSLEKVDTKDLIL